jgi:hypothetical protein
MHMKHHSVPLPEVNCDRIDGAEGGRNVKPAFREIVPRNLHAAEIKPRHSRRPSPRWVRVSSNEDASPILIVNVQIRYQHPAGL